MKKIPVDGIVEQMVLAREIRGKSGNVLLNKGAILNSSLGRRLKNWGVNFVHIEGDDDITSPSLSTEVPAEEIRAMLERKFSKVIHSPIMKEIFAATYQFKLHRGSE